MTLHEYSQLLQKYIQDNPELSTLPVYEEFPTGPWSDQMRLEPAIEFTKPQVLYLKEEEGKQFAECLDWIKTFYQKDGQSEEEILNDFTQIIVL